MAVARRPVPTGAASSGGPRALRQRYATALAGGLPPDSRLSAKSPEYIVRAASDLLHRSVSDSEAGDLARPARLLQPAAALALGLCHTPASGDSSHYGGDDSDDAFGLNAGAPSFQPTHGSGSGSGWEGVEESDPGSWYGSDEPEAQDARAAFESAAAVYGFASATADATSPITSLGGLLPSASIAVATPPKPINPWALSGLNIALPLPSGLGSSLAAAPQTASPTAAGAAVGSASSHGRSVAVGSSLLLPSPPLGTSYSGASAPATPARRDTLQGAQLQPFSSGALGLGSLGAVMPDVTGASRAGTSALLGETEYASPLPRLSDMTLLHATDGFSEQSLAFQRGPRGFTGARSSSLALLRDAGAPHGGDDEDGDGERILAPAPAAGLAAITALGDDFLSF